MGLVISKGLTLRKEFQVQPYMWEFPQQYGLWSPAEISTALWLDAADASTVTESSGLISQVNDKSGNGRNFTASGGARPTYTSNGLNGKNIFTFGGSQWLTSADAASTWTFLHSTSGSSVFMAAKPGDTSDPNTIYSFCGTNTGGSTGVGYVLNYDDRPSQSRNNALATSAARGVSLNFAFLNITGNDAIAANVPSIIAHRGDPGNATASLRSIINVNGDANLANNSATFAAVSTDPSATLQVGANSAGGIPLVGYISEFIVLSSVATQNTRQRIEGYLAHKWGLTANLPSDHPYKTVGPTP
jgi:hypothetical protein